MPLSKSLPTERWPASASGLLLKRYPRRNSWLAPNHPIDALKVFRDAEDPHEVVIIEDEIYVRQYIWEAVYGDGYVKAGEGGG